MSNNLLKAPQRSAWVRIASTLPEILRAASIAVATFLIVSFIVVSLKRAVYPYELEWMEGGSVDHVRWLLSGHRLYAHPTLAFIPYAYTPLYYYLGAALCWIVGVGFWPLRALSIVSTLLTAGIIFRLLRHETKNNLAAFWGAAFYLGTYSLAGYWFDLGRVDALEILFIALAVDSTRRGGAGPSALAAGVWLSLGVLTKQTAVVGILPIGLYLFIGSRKRLGYFLLGIAVVGCGGLLFLDHVHDGWLRYYTFTLLSGHDTEPSAYWGFWRADVNRLMPLAVMMVISGWLWRRNRGTHGASLWFYETLTLALLVASYASRLHAGAANNVLMPALLGGALGLGLATHVFGAAWDSVDCRAAREPLPLARRVVFYALVLLQFSLLAYAPWNHVPSASDKAGGDAFVKLLRGLNGDAYVIDHGYYAALAGKQTFAQGMALADVIRGDRGPVSRELVNELALAIRTQRFGAVVVGTVVPDTIDPFNSLWKDGLQLASIPDTIAEDLQTWYSPAGRLFGDTVAFTPVVGWRRRPAVVLLPKPVP